MMQCCVVSERPLHGLSSLVYRNNGYSSRRQLDNGRPFLACLRGVARKNSATVIAKSRLLRTENTTSLAGTCSLRGVGGGGLSRLRVVRRAGPTYGAGQQNRRSTTTLVTCQVAGAGTLNGGWDFNVPLSKDASILQKVRATCFYATTFVIAAPLFIVMLILHPFVLLFDKERRKLHHLVNKVWARMTTFLFYHTEIVGWENLPSADEGVVYVANHQSFLDIYTLFQLGRPFKFISKISNFVIPIIGWAMYLTGHIPLKREDQKSQLQCLRKCVDLVQRGVSVIFFPEGTRTSDGTMAAFKKGAFSVAAKAKASVIPITLIGTGKLMPNKMEHTLRSGLVKVVIHPPIRGGNPDELCQKARAVIGDTLRQHGLPVH